MDASALPLLNQEPRTFEILCIYENHLTFRKNTADVHIEKLLLAHQIRKELKSMDLNFNDILEKVKDRDEGNSNYPSMKSILPNLFKAADYAVNNNTKPGLRLRPNNC